jgi:hypothetical protein
MTKTLYTTAGDPVLVDDQDYERVKQYNLYTCNNGTVHIYANTPGTSTPFHRYLMNAKPGEVIDHANGDRFDNRRCNLRVTDYSGNNANRKVSRTNRLGVKGVRQIPGGKFNARIYKSGRWYMLGTHETLEQAARAYDAKARELFGEFARLNGI